MGGSLEAFAKIRLISMASGERYQFGSFAVDADERQLAKRDHCIPLQPKAFDLLLALVRHAGRLVTKRELLQLVWPNSFVDEGILAVHVSALRKILDEGRKDLVRSKPCRVGDIVSERM